MAKILITAGPTREYLDPVRYLTNASSGRMGAALAAAVIQAGYQAVVVSGPVEVEYPPEAEVHRVVSTKDMLDACRRLFPQCAGLIGAAAPCDYRPPSVAEHKIHKTSGPFRLDLVETPDVVATLAAGKRDSQWIVAFALETKEPIKSALDKMRCKQCDMIVVNGPGAIQSSDTAVELIHSSGDSLGRFKGDKTDVAKKIIDAINCHLMQ